MVLSACHSEIFSRIFKIFFIFILLNRLETLQSSPFPINYESNRGNAIFIHDFRLHHKIRTLNTVQTPPLSSVVSRHALRLKGGADDDSDENLIGDLVLDDIEGKTLEQEIEALERELEEAQDSRAVAEQVG
jgi:hypothetical protein